MTQAHYQRQKAENIEWLIDQMKIDQVGAQAFATLPSVSKVNTRYTVTIDESGKVPVAIGCGCVGQQDYGKTCLHMLAVNLFFQRVYARPAKPKLERMLYLDLFQSTTLDPACY